MTPRVYTKFPIISCTRIVATAQNSHSKSRTKRETGVAVVNESFTQWMSALPVLDYLRLRC